MTIVFRNYVPKNEALKSKLAKSDAGVPSREAEVLLNEAKKRARAPLTEDASVLVAPKRANWDLKRDVEKRLKKLAKRTQKAVAELAEELNQAEEADEEEA